MPTRGDDIAAAVLALVTDLRDRGAVVVSVDEQVLALLRALRDWQTGG